MNSSPGCNKFLYLCRPRAGSGANLRGNGSCSEKCPADLRRRLSGLFLLGDADLGPRGLTMMELLMVFIILGIMTVMAVPSFQNWLPRYRLKSAVSDLRSQMNLSKIRAVKDNCDWVIQFNPPGGYTLFSDNGRTGTGADLVFGTADDVIDGARRNNGVNDAAGEAATAETVSLPDGVTFGDAGRGPIPGGSQANDGVTFGNNRAVFRADGRPQNLGTAYLQNNLGETYALSVILTGNINIRKWDNGDWRDQ